MKHSSQTPAGLIRFYASLVFGSLVLLISAATLTQLNTSRSLDNRSQATTDTPNAQMRIVTDPSSPQVNKEVTISIQINTGATQISGVEIKNLVLQGTQDIPTPTLTPAGISQLATISNQLTKTDAKTATIQLVNILSNPITSYSTTNNWVTLATLKLTPTTVGTLTLTFDATKTLVTQYGGGAINILSPIPSPTAITIAAASTDNNKCTQNEDVCDLQSCNYNAQSCHERKLDEERKRQSSTNTGGTCTTPTVPQNVKARGGSNPGEILISWQGSDKVSHYAVSFGKESKKYQWGSPNIGNVREFVIQKLEPGTKYYVVVSAVNECGGSAYSGEVWTISSGTKPSTGTGFTNYQPQIIALPTSPTPKPSSTPEMTSYQDPTPAPQATDGGAIQSVLAGLLKKPFLLIMGLILLGGIVAAFLAGGKRTKVITPTTTEANISQEEINQLKSEPAWPASDLSSRTEEEALQEKFQDQTNISEK